MKMLTCAWYSKEESDAKVVAVLKRTHTIVNTPKCLYVRLASEAEKLVIRISPGDKIDFLRADSREIYDYHR